MSQKYHESYEFEPGSLLCDKCQVKMEPGEVIMQDIGEDFPIQMPKFPSCRQVFIPEELAVGKILQVERALEDK